MFVVTITNNGQKYWLRGTVWAFSEDRAQKFETALDARIHFEEKAKKFTKASLRRLVRIEEV